jgi:hypothetical protein
MGPLGTSANYGLIVLAPSDCEDGEFGGMNGRGNRSTWRKPAPAPLCPPQIPLDQIGDWTRAAAVGSQRLTASAMARPKWIVRKCNNCGAFVRCCLIISKIVRVNGKLYRHKIRVIFIPTTSVPNTFRPDKYLANSVGNSCRSSCEVSRCFCVILTKIRMYR